jgi:hypothetical protein
MSRAGIDERFIGTRLLRVPHTLMPCLVFFGDGSMTQGERQGSPGVPEAL